MTKTTVTLALAVALATTGMGCAGDPAKATDTAQPPADNSGRNVRDRDDATLTAGDQSEKATDIALTQAIRKDVVANDALSTLAHNVKIISVDGVVTLRGPVKSDIEKQQISATAERIAGAGKVLNELEIAQ